MITLSFRIKTDKERLSIRTVKKLIEHIRREFGLVEWDLKHRSKEGNIILFFEDENYYKNFLDKFNIQINSSFQTNIGMKGVILFDLKIVE